MAVLAAGRPALRLTTFRLYFGLRQEILDQLQHHVGHVFVGFDAVSFESLVKVVRYVHA